MCDLTDTVARVPAEQDGAGEAEGPRGCDNLLAMSTWHTYVPIPRHHSSRKNQVLGETGESSTGTTQRKGICRRENRKVIKNNDGRKKGHWGQLEPPWQSRDNV